MLLKLINGSNTRQEDEVFTCYIEVMQIFETQSKKELKGPMLIFEMMYFNLRRISHVEQVLIKQLIWQRQYKGLNSLAYSS